jgi:hypothetical protein
MGTGQKGRGRETSATTTMEVTSLEEEPMPTATFVLPPGYSRTEALPAMLGLRP